MQTDPNWANFLYDESTDTLTMLDFGAARRYDKPFIDNYLRLVMASAGAPHERETRERECVWMWLCSHGGLACLQITDAADANTC
jgi:hypothetical protein